MIKIRPFDVVICLFSLFLCIFSTVFALKKARSTGSLHLVIGSPGGEYIYPLEKDAAYSIQGLLGESIIEVHDGEAHFLDSPCPNKTCVQAGFIHRSGEWAACLPNDVFIRIEGSKKDNIDAEVF